MGSSEEEHGQVRREGPLERRRQEACRELEALGDRKKRLEAELDEESVNRSFTLQGLTARVRKREGGDRVARTIPKRSDNDSDLFLNKSEPNVLIKSEGMDASQGWISILSYDLVYLQLALQPKGTGGARDWSIHMGVTVRWWY